MNKVPENIVGASTPVLIVDDNTQYSKVLKTILAGGFGYTDVTTVDNIGEAFALISSQPERFKLLFVDFHFPQGETGGKLLKQLNDSKLLDNKVAFLITAEPNVDNQREAMRAGAKGVVAKPFDRNKLREQLDKVQREINADKMDSF